MSSAGIMQKHVDITKSRVEQFHGKNHLQGAMYEDPKLEITEIGWWETNERVPFSTMMEHQQDFQPIKKDHKFGPIWSTHWLRLQFRIPLSMKEEISKGKEKKLLLIFDFGGESLVYSKEGRPLQGLNGQGGEDRRDWFIVHPSLAINPDVEEDEVLYLECACNEMFGNSLWNVGPSAPTDRDYSLKEIKFVFLNEKIWKLMWDYTIILDIVKHLDKESIQRAEALRTANEIVNLCDFEDKSSIDQCLEVTKRYFNSSIANRSSGFHMSAIGHCHIDTAWLWPYDETKRKCARSWSTQLRLIESYPDYKFVCSQPQQLAWLKENYPSLYEEILLAAKAGSFIPIGGSWVEMDCNIPSGESMARQFLYGQRFLKKEFGSYSPTFWLPDTFGYAAQLPQIMKQASIKSFLTQKLSWNQINKFPHSTFIWEGIDGTQVLTHFPPADTYCSHATVNDLHKSETNFKDRERSNNAMLVFGHGDGGGGPNPKMIEMLERMKNGVGGLPTVEFRSPNDFFEELTNIQHRLCTWVGELYFEYHRGTYTTQANNKLQNRRGEILLREIEFYSVLARSINKNYAYPSLDEYWKLLLLNQFHDVIPGTSIPEVYKDSKSHYEQIQSQGILLKNAALTAIKEKITPPPTAAFAVFNSLPFPRRELVEIPSSFISADHHDHYVSKQLLQKLENGNYLSPVIIPSMGYTIVHPDSQISSPPAVTVVHDAENQIYILSNEFVSVQIHESGHIRSLRLESVQKELIQPSSHHQTHPSYVLQPKINLFGNHFVLFDDHPLYWDAWDVDVYHLEKRKEVQGAKSSLIIERGPLRASLQFEYHLSSSSSMTQIISLTNESCCVEFDTQVDWHESHKFLKVEFPFNLRTTEVTYEIPFGYVKRPNHFNTSWDLAKFEVCAHKFADMSEYDVGVALLNDCKYGYSARANLLTLSLLRSPKDPDDAADMGSHRFRYALFPHSGVFQTAGVVERALSFNIPLSVSELQPCSGDNVNDNNNNNNLSSETFSFVQIDKPGVILDAVKKAEDSESVILRFYESFGGSSSVVVSIMNELLHVKSASTCNILEEGDVPLEVSQLGGSSQLHLNFKPFQIITVKLTQ